MTPEDLCARFGERLRHLRRERGHSQEAFAALANIDRSAYGKLERGLSSISITTMARIAAALDLPLAKLLEEVDLDTSSVRAWPRMARGPAPFSSEGARRKARSERLS